MEKSIRTGSRMNKQQSSKVRERQKDRFIRRNKEILELLRPILAKHQIEVVTVNDIEHIDPLKVPMSNKFVAYKESSYRKQKISCSWDFQISMLVEESEMSIVVSNMVDSIVRALT
jgi:hypothetical protein